ncbi:MAG: ATP-binding protein [Planctomycetota bacterium]
MTVTESELKSLLRSELFDHIPLNIAVIDRSHNIVDANTEFREYFGEWRDLKCYEAYKGASVPCPDCEAMKVFEDGKTRVFEEMGRDARGYAAHYVTHAVAVLGPNGAITHVVKLSENVTDIRNQQREYQILFERVPCYVAILDRDFRIIRANEKLRETFGVCRGRFCYEVYKKTDRPCEDCPAAMTFADGQEHTSSKVGIDKEGKETHYIVTTSPLSRSKEGCSHVVEILTDITQMKELEHEKLEAERLAAVGQTVAGLAHSVKNMLMGVEGGMYMVTSGVAKGRQERIAEGAGMLQRNIEKLSSLVRDFLSFARGRKPHVEMLDPNTLVDEIIGLYAETAKTLGVKLAAGPQQPLAKAPMDHDGIHTCLTNLVSNAIDACRMSSKPGCDVILAAREEHGVLIFEVSDNGCGMDYDVKKRVFTTFFTTKGAEGTGLGLLTTRKIAQEHGGKISVESAPGEGSVFRIELPRDRLPQLNDSEEA